MADAPPPASRFLAAAWRALGGDEAWLDRVEIAGQGDLPSAFAVTDLAAASIGAAALAIGERVASAKSRPPKIVVDRRLASLLVRLFAQAAGLEFAAGLGPDRRRLPRR